MLKVIVAGSRRFKDYKIVKSALDYYLANQDEVEIVSGCAGGVDSLGERYAEEKGIPVKKFPALWDKHGKAAGPIRNKQMAEYADALVLFWDGTSPGSRNMFENARKMGLKIREIKI